MEPKQIKVGPLSRGWLPVRVVKVESPSSLWIQLRTGRIFDELQEELDWKMDRRAYQYAVWSHRIQAGQLVTTRDKGHWHRGKVIKSNQQQTSVLLGDWGWAIKKPTSSVFLLPKQFLELEWQAIKCKLHAVKPPEGESAWPDSAKKFTKLLAEGREGCIKIRKTYENNLASVELRVNWEHDAGEHDLRQTLIFGLHQGRLTNESGEGDDLELRSALFALLLPDTAVTNECAS